MNGTIKIVTDLYSKVYNTNQTIRIYLPAGYDESEQSYPVVYLHDGQWMYSKEQRASWNADLVADELIEQKAIPPVILVSVDCDEAVRRQQMTHITPPPFRRMGRRGYVPCFAFSGKGKGYDYEAFLVEDVKDYMDKNYRTMPEKENTVLAGSSMGGIVTLCIGMNRHETFGKLGLLSPAVHWITDEFYNGILNYNQNIWLDCGMCESYYVDNARELYQIFKSVGYEQGENLNFLVQPDAVHTEAYFSQRFRMMLLWMFGEKAKIKDVSIFGAEKAAVSGHKTVLNTVITYENGVMSSDMDAQYQIAPEGILDITPEGIVCAKHSGEAVITYRNGEWKTEKAIKVVNSLSQDIILNIIADIPEATPKEDPIVYHFFRDQYVVLEHVRENTYAGSIGVPRDWQFYGHFTRCIENRDKKRECTITGQEVDRYVCASGNQTIHYIVEKWKE